MKTKQILTKEKRLENYLAQEREGYVNSGKLMFLGNPDEWYEPLTVCCVNGHVSHRTLKSEALGKTCCLACMGDIYLCPPTLTEDELKAILDI